MEICQQTSTNFPHKGLLMKLGITDVPGNRVEHSANSLRDGELKSPTSVGRE